LFLLSAKDQLMDQLLLSLDRLPDKPLTTDV